MTLYGDQLIFGKTSESCPALPSFLALASHNELDYRNGDDRMIPLYRIEIWRASL